MQRLIGRPVEDLCLVLDCSVEQVFKAAYRHYGRTEMEAMRAYNMYIDMDMKYDNDEIIKDFAIIVIGTGHKPRIKAERKKQ